MSTSEDQANVARLREHIGTTDPATRLPPTSAPVLVTVPCPSCVEQLNVGLALEAKCQKCDGHRLVLIDRERLRVLA